MRWFLQESLFFAGKLRRYQKKHPNESKATLTNLDSFFKALKAGIQPSLIQAGFIHREPNGVVAIDQKGIKGSARQTRLYVYAVQVEGILHLITIGDKTSQKRDLDDCRKFVLALRKDGKDNG